MITTTTTKMTMMMVVMLMMTMMAMTMMMMMMMMMPNTFQNQVIVGFLFLIISGMNINDPKTKTTADILNNVILFIVFVITLVNAVISGFGIKHTDTSVLEALDR